MLAAVCRAIDAAIGPDQHAASRRDDRGSEDAPGTAPEPGLAAVGGEIGSAIGCRPDMTRSGHVDIHHISAQTAQRQALPGASTVQRSCHAAAPDSGEEGPLRTEGQSLDAIGGEDLPMTVLPPGVAAVETVPHHAWTQIKGVQVSW